MNADDYLKQHKEDLQELYARTMVLADATSRLCAQVEDLLKSASQNAGITFAADVEPQNVTLLFDAEEVH